MEVDGLVGLGRSAAWEDRARAGRELASLAGQPRADECLLQLLLDPDNERVTVETATSLLANPDFPRLRVYLRAYAIANPETGDHLNTALYRDPADRARLAADVRTLLDDSDDAVASGALRVLEWLGL